MLTTKFFFSDQDKATKVASQMASAACKAKGFGEQDGVRIFPYIKIGRASCRERVWLLV